MKQSKMISAMDLRIQNRKRIVSLLVKKNATRIELRNQTDFSYSTILNLIGDLEKENFISQESDADSTGGRKSRIIGINGDKSFFIAIELLSDKFKWGVYNLKNEELAGEEYGPVDIDNAQDHFDDLIDTVYNHCRQMGITERLRSIGIIIPGYYREENDCIINPSIPSFEGLKIRHSVAKRFTIPILVKNDANVGAFSYLSNQPKKPDINAIFLVIKKYGLGAGIIINGQLFFGSNGYAGEPYSLLIKNEGEIRTFGDFLSPEDDISLVEKRIGAEVSDEDFFRLFLEGNELLVDLYQKNVLTLSSGILQLLRLFNPETVVLSGFYNGYGDRLAVDIKDAVRNIADPWDCENLSIKLMDLSGDSMMRSIVRYLTDLWIESLWT